MLEILNELQIPGYIKIFLPLPWQQIAYNEYLQDKYLETIEIKLVRETPFDISLIPQYEHFWGKQFPENNNDDSDLGEYLAITVLCDGLNCMQVSTKEETTSILTSEDPESFMNNLQQIYNMYE